MRRASWILFLGAILLPLIAFSATASQTALTTQVLTASPSQTVVAAEFDQAALSTRLSSLDFDESPSDGYGMILAIAGHGAPVATVENFELGDPVASGLSSLVESDAATSSSELVILSEPQIIHDLRVVSVGFRPVMRDAAGVLRQVRNIRTAVNTLSGASLNEKPDAVTLSSAFYPVYRTVIANLDDLYPENSLRAPGRFLVVTSASRLASIRGSQYFQNWIDLKKRKGYQVDTLGLTNTTFNSVRAAIETAYNDHSQPDLEYVTIIGDTNEVATHTATNPENGEHSVGDNLYYTLAGNDLLPDVLNGRISGTTAAQYGNYFAKEVGYETNPYTTDTRWFQSITCVAGNYVDGTTPTYPVTPVWNVNWTRERMMEDGCIVNADTFYYHTTQDPPPGSYSANIRADIDSGVCAVFYRGWASEQEWQKPIFSNGDVDQLNNVYRTPAVFGIVCGSGNFGFGNPCLGEEFTTGVGTVTQPKGAIIFFGASDLHTNTRHNNAILGGIIQALMSGIRSAGALQMAGKLEAWRQFPLEQIGGENSTAYYYILGVFNLLGDPEVQIYICQPGTMSVDAPAQLSVGQTLVPVTVTSGGQPLAGVVVTLRFAGSETIAVERTDAAGHVYLSADFSQTGTAQLTVWKSTYFLQRIDIPVGSAGFDPKITALNWTAGGDNLPNPGESCTFTITAQNFGTASATMSATVTSLDPRITVTGGTGTFASIEPGASGTSTPFSISLGSEMYDGEHPRLSVALQDGSNNVTREVEIPVTAPNPIAVTVRIDDGNNGILESGETAVPVYLTVMNAGHQAGSDLTCTVTSFDNAISFPTPTCTWSSLDVGQTAESGTAFTAQLGPNVTPGRQIGLRFAFSMNGVIMGQSYYMLPTGAVTINAPTGPDAYGYYAYEDIDNGYAATPPSSTTGWIELDPAHGGSGADAHAVHDDSYFTTGIPSFTYYGQSFSNIWVCSNGFFSFEQMIQPEFRNWQLPAPIGAPSLVAPFWQDLFGDHTCPNNDTLHYIWTRNDPDQNRFIIEWRAFRQTCIAGDGQPYQFPATFEAILEYPPSGDGSILLQYNDVNMYRGGTNNNFCTVGWEDSRHERGMTLTYADVFPASMDTIRSGRAIRITRQAPDSYNAADPRVSILPKQFALHEAYPNPFNPTTELRFDLANPGQTTLRIYDMLGREVATLVDGQRAAGSYSVAFDGRDLPSGLYFARLTSGANTQVGKLMLIK
jgi:hypothetical protein